MQRDEFRDPKRVRTSEQYSGASSGGQSMDKDRGSFQHRGVHAALLAFEGRLGSRGAHSSGQSSLSTQQRPTAVRVIVCLQLLLINQLLLGHIMGVDLRSTSSVSILCRLTVGPIALTP